jgi:quercetin dioxygenase-like cupin family protein
LKLVRLVESQEYEPHGHQGVVNHLLAGRALGTPAISVWHGEIEPGGGSDLHSHANSVQIYAGLTGELTVSNSAEEIVIGPGDVAILSAGEKHDIHNRSSTAATLLVISSPALR